MTNFQFNITIKLQIPRKFELQLKSIIVVVHGEKKVANLLNLEEFVELFLTGR
jgi:hypothetical protein